MYQARKPVSVLTQSHQQPCCCSSCYCSPPQQPPTVQLLPHLPLVMAAMWDSGSSSLVQGKDLPPLWRAGLLEPEHRLLQLVGSHLWHEAPVEGGSSEPQFPGTHRHHLPSHRQPHLPALTQSEQQHPSRCDPSQHRLPNVPPAYRPE